MPLPPIKQESDDQVAAAAEEEEATEVGNSPVWNQHGWTLTWPIWHLLSLHERKQLAHDHGYKTIGEFEEYMSLHRAMDDSETVAPKPYSNEQAYASMNETKKKAAVVDDSKTNQVVDEEDDSDLRGKESP